MIALHVPHTAWIMTAEGWREITIDRPEARQFVDARGVINDRPICIWSGVFVEGGQILSHSPRRHGKSFALKLMGQSGLFEVLP